MTALSTPAEAPAAQDTQAHAVEAAIVALLTPHAHAQRLSASRLQARLEGFEDAEYGTPASVEAALLRLIAAGMVEETTLGYQLTCRGLIATRLPGDTLTGHHVAVRPDQNRIGGPKYPGRIGIVLRQNHAGRNPDGLWHVRLEPTARAGERVELFCTKELDVLSRPAAAAGVTTPPSTAQP